MLTPEELKDLPEDVAEIFEECEDEILKLIAERINAVGYINTVSMWQLIKRKESLLLRKDVAKVLARYTGRSEKEIRSIFKKAGASSLAHDDEALKANTLSKKRKRKRPLDRILKQSYDQTKGTFKNWTGTTASNASSRFVRAMDKAALQVQSGAFSYDEAIRMATRDLADHMDYVQYPSGHRDTLEVASRRAVRTGANQMASKLTLQRCKDLGIEFVETTAHAGARTYKSLDCRNHSWWQGKVFHLSKEGAKGEDGKFYPGFYSFEHAGYGYGEGICGWNCRHSFHPFIPGISEQVYTPEELDNLNEKVIEYNGREYTRYEADQHQRSLERTIRKYKRRYILSEGVGDQKETERNRAYVNKWSNELDRFTRATGLKRDYERERETVGSSYFSEVSLENSRSDSKGLKMNTLDDVRKISTSEVLDLVDHDSLKQYFNEKYGIAVRGFEKKKIDECKVMFAGIDDMLKRFPLIAKTFNNIEYVANLKDYARMNELGLMKVGHSGYNDYATGLHEPIHLLDYILSKSDSYSFSEGILKKVLKDMKIRMNSKGYKRLAEQFCDYRDTGLSTEMLAYAAETEYGGGNGNELSRRLVRELEKQYGSAYAEKT